MSVSASVSACPLQRPSAGHGGARVAGVHVGQVAERSSLQEDEGQLPGGPPAVGLRAAATRKIPDFPQHRQVGAGVHRHVSSFCLLHSLRPPLLSALVSGLAGSWRTWTAWQVDTTSTDSVSDPNRKFPTSASSFAVLISYSHTFNAALKRSPLSIVTALVDKIGNKVNLRGFCQKRGAGNKRCLCARQT